MREHWNALRSAVFQQPISIWLMRTWNGFWAHRNLVNASALTYTTLLAMVPLIAVVLALLKAAGFQDALRPFLLDQFPVLTAEAIDALLSWIDLANAQAVGGIGFAALLITTWSMLRNVETSLNHIFAVRHNRGILRQLGEYPAMLLFGAVMVVASIGIRTILETPALFDQLLGADLTFGTSLLVTLSPWLTAWVAFYLMYSWMPNQSVAWSSALFGAFVGGSLFQLVQLGYIEAQLGFGRYHAVYGALAQLPIVMIWIYVSWIVVLLGAEGIAARAALHERPPSEAEAMSPQVVALAALREVLDAFGAGTRTPRAEELAVRLGVSVHAVRAALEPLLRADVLVEPDDQHGYLPATAPAALSLAQVLDPLRKS
jgi:membrane protein